MRAIIVDDEKLALESMRAKLSRIQRIHEIHAFSSPEAALRHFEESGGEIAFLDIQMPRMDGLALASRMRAINPGVIIIFVTGYAEYSLDAFKLHADGYLMKPMSEEDINRELDDVARRRLPAEAPKRIRVQCFGNFEVFVDQKPLRFERTQTKELLAYLVDRSGAAVNTAQLCAVLWEDTQKIGQEEQRTRLRLYLSDLSRTLKKVDAEEMLLKRRNSFSVVPDAFDCDYYAYLDGNPTAANKYRGEYMSQYSWAENTLGALT